MSSPSETQRPYGRGEPEQALSRSGQWEGMGALCPTGYIDRRLFGRMEQTALTGDNNGKGPETSLGHPDKRSFVCQEYERAR